MKRLLGNICFSTKVLVLVYAPSLLSVLCTIFSAHGRGDQDLIARLTANILSTSILIAVSRWSNNMTQVYYIDEQLFQSILWPFLCCLVVPYPEDRDTGLLSFQSFSKIFIKIIWCASLNAPCNHYIRTAAVITLTLELAIMSHLSMLWTLCFLLITYCIRSLCSHNNCSGFATLILMFACDHLVENISSLAPPIAAAPVTALSPIASVQIFQVCLFSLILICTLSTITYWILAAWPLGGGNGRLNMRERLEDTDGGAMDITVRLLVTSAIAAVVVVSVTMPYLACITADNLAVVVAAQLYRNCRTSMFWCSIIAASIHLASQSVKRDRWCIGSWSLPCSKTIVRKIYHVAAVAMFSPALAIYAESLSFVSLAMGGAVCLFLAVEFVRCFLLVNVPSGRSDGLGPMVDALNAFLASFQESSAPPSPVKGDRAGPILMRPIIFSHISLLLGVGSPVWLYCRYCASDPLSHSADRHGEVSLRPLLIMGLATVGVGDTAASVVGSLFGRLRWPGSKKTYLGTVAAFVSMEIYAAGMTVTEWWSWPPKLAVGASVCMTLTLLLAALAEAVTTENDNILLPLYASTVFLSLRYCMNAAF